MKTIASRQNALVARFRAVAHNEEDGVILLDGPHLVGEALAAGLTLEETIVAEADVSRADIAPLVARCERDGIPITAATSMVMSAVSPVRSSSAIVAIAIRPAEPADEPFAAANALVVIACDVQDPGNAGAIVRVAEAAGATALVVAGPSADPFGWKALRGSMGSALRLPIAVHADAEEAASRAREHGCKVVATVPRGGRSLFDVDLTGSLAVLIGGEGAGLAPALVEAADVRLTIPMTPPVESLNAAVTAALILYEAKRQRR
jgi:RNA methyltransferase, TrmH family